uniref:Uncharacterized protein n=1 Tax=Romanomermis culicivorax TaxID=13658 RepID=A0A915KRA3_ROMCU
MAACKMCGWGESSVDPATEGNDKLTCIQTALTYDGRTQKENAEALSPDGIGFMFWGSLRRGPYFVSVPNL